MNLFHVIDDATVILRARGVFRQTKVFARGEEIYAAQGNGFIRLFKDGGTSVPSISWIDIDVAVNPDKLGRLKRAEPS